MRICPWSQRDQGSVKLKNKNFQRKEINVSAIAGPFVPVGQKDWLRSDMLRVFPGSGKCKLASYFDYLPYPEICGFNLVSWVC